MATRNKTLVFKQERHERNLTKYSSGTRKRINEEEEGLLQNESGKLGVSEFENIGRKRSPSITLTWIELMQSAKNSFIQIKKDMKLLTELQDQQLRANFLDEEDKSEQYYQDKTKQLLTSFKSTFEILKRIQKSSTIHFDEASVKINVERILGNEFQQLCQSFCNNQKNWLQKLQKLLLRFGLVLHIEDSPPNPFHAWVSVGNPSSFIPQELKSSKEEELNLITNSINEIFNMISDIEALVVEKGSVMDRIDYNLEEMKKTVNEFDFDFDPDPNFDLRQKKKIKIICFSGIAILVILFLIIIIVIVAIKT